MNHEQKNINNSSIQQSDSAASLQSDNDIVLSVKNVSKKFCKNLRRSMAYGILDLSKNLVGIKPDTTNLGKDEFWAMDNVSLELRRGETLGIIGVNGSGKSTLLRLLTGIFPPDKGEIATRGRIGSLIAIGAGFHPHMTGRENILLNGTILGMTRNEIQQKFDNIIGFADIGDFLDAPVATYSSGMRVRLGFAIAINCEPDILLVDEVLSVGDIGFRNKSLRRMSEFRQKANAVIFVSHNLDQVQYLCQKTIILGKGKIIFSGKTDEAIRFYEKNTYLNVRSEVRNVMSGLDFGVDVLECKFNGTPGCNEEPALIEQNQDINIDIKVKFKNNFDDCAPHFVCNSEDGQMIWMVYANEYNLSKQNYEKGIYSFSVHVPCLYLREGVYHINFTFRNIETFETFERKAQVGTFFSVGGSKRQRATCLTVPPVDCKCEKLE